MAEVGAFLAKSSNNLFTADLTLAANRNHNLNGFNFAFTGVGNVGIGTTTPTEKIDINGNVKLNSFGSDIPLLINRRALGTQTSPTALTSGQGLFALQTQGYNGTAYQTTRDNIVITTSENWTPTANGTTMRFAIVTNGTTTNRNALRIYNNTDIVFGSMTTIPSLGSYNKVIASQLESSGKLMNMLYTNDGTRNRRIGLFLDDVNNEYGFDFSKASGTDIPFVIKNAGIENFRITSTGNVGVNTINPTAKFEVQAFDGDVANKALTVRNHLDTGDLMSLNNDGRLLLSNRIQAPLFSGLYFGFPELNSVVSNGGALVLNASAVLALHAENKPLIASINNYPALVHSIITLETPDGNMWNGSMSFYVDEVNNDVKIKVRKSDGTFFTKTI